MRKKYQILSLLLALLLIGSNIAFSGHNSSHAVTDPGFCSLCIHPGKPNHAIKPVFPPVFVVPERKREWDLLQIFSAKKRQLQNKDLDTQNLLGIGIDQGTAITIIGATLTEAFAEFCNAALGLFCNTQVVVPELHQAFTL